MRSNGLSFAVATSAEMILSLVGCSSQADRPAEMATSHQLALASGDGASPRVADDPGCGPWGTGTMTGYNNSDSADDPNSGSLTEFTGLTEDFYNNVAIAAVDSSDWDRDKYHWVDIRYNDQVGRVGVWDMCVNEDCPDGTSCCTDNKTRFASPGYLLDLETRTAQRLFGVTDAEDTLMARVEYRVCESFDPDAIAARFGAHR